MAHYYEEVNALCNVARFHKLFKLPIEDSPIIPEKDRWKLRLNLIEEELQELKDAIDGDDLVEVADAFADLQYVLSGAILEFGLGYKFKRCFDEIQKSNMSKACKTIEEAEETQKYYLEEKDTESYVEERNGLYLVYRKSDSKVLKSINYIKVDLEPIIFPK